VIDKLEALLGAPVVLEELKRKPGGRRTLRARGPERTAIVKLYASGRAATVARRVASLSTGPVSPQVPRLLMVDPELDMVVLSEVLGMPLRLAVLEGETAACHRAGVALARWHHHWRGTRPGNLRAHTFERELEILRSRAEHAPAQIAAAVLLEMAALPTEGWAPVTVVHRDLYEEHVLLGAEVGLIDLDDAALGPPELDLGNLCAHLVLLGIRAQRDLSGAEDALLEGYESGGMSIDCLLLDRCRVLALVRLACIHGSETLLGRAREWPPHVGR
jgi:hypothetical protein